MSELESQTPRRATRSRGLGIHISEPRESPRRAELDEAHVELEQARVEPEQVTREVLAAEQMVDVPGDGRTTPVEVDVRGHDGPEPSRAAETEVDPGVSPQ